MQMGSEMDLRIGSSCLEMEWTGEDLSLGRGMLDQGNALTNWWKATNDMGSIFRQKIDWRRRSADAVEYEHMDKLLLKGQIGSNAAAAQCTLYGFNHGETKK